MVWFARQLLAAILSFLLAVPAFSNENDQVGTDTYDYDAFGNLIHQTGTTYNNYLFAGEQFDPDLNLYYSRARYLNTSTGRFWSMDTFEGDLQSPPSLHKYTYAANDPIDRLDRSGHDYNLVSVAVAGTIFGVIAGATIGAIRGGVQGALAGATIGFVTGGVGAVAIVSAGLGLAAIAGISAGAGVLATSFGALELAIAFGASDYARARTRREKAAAVVAISFAILGFGLGAAGAASAEGSAISDLDVANGTLSLRGQIPDELLEPPGQKLGQMIAAAGLKGQPNARQLIMQSLNQLIQTARMYGTYATGDSYVGSETLPGATIYRVGDAYLIVDANGVPRSHVPEADGTWGVVEKYHALGGK